jgi:hypothetical protein
MGLRGLRGTDMLIWRALLDLDGTMASSLLANATNDSWLIGAKALQHFSSTCRTRHGPPPSQDKAEGMALLDDTRCSWRLTADRAAKSGLTKWLYDAYRLEAE